MSTARRRSPHSTSSPAAWAPRAAAPRVSGSRFDITPEGPFSLREAVQFGFGQRHDEAFVDCMRLCFCVDGYTAQAAVVVRQDERGCVRGEISGVAGEPVAHERIAAQVARVLSLDVDARGFVRSVEANPLLAPLMAAAPGLRPPLFHSPYEGALWAVLSARRPRQLAERWRAQLSRAAGASFAVAGRTMWSVPLPQRICELGSQGLQDVCGIERQRAERVQAVAEAALAGELDAEKIARGDTERVRTQLQTLPGIGPFYADLILLRASGATDVLSAHEPRMLALLAKLNGRSTPCTPAEAEAFASPFSPFRTWVAVLIRAAGPRVLRCAAD